MFESNHEMKKRKTEKYLVKQIDSEIYFKDKIDPFIPENIVSRYSISVKIESILML